MKGEIRSLTGIRGVAALWVIGYHIMGWMDNPLTPAWFFGKGDLAVDIFFLLSGFVMMHVHAGMKPAAWPDFFIRRIFRLYPLHIAIMALLAAKVLASHQATGPGDYFSWQSFPFVLTLTSLDFGFQADHWNMPTWSLNVEMICYLAFPLAALLLPRLRRGLPARWLAVLLVFSCLSLLNLHGFGYYAPFEGPPAFARGGFEFLAGALLYQATTEYSRHRDWVEVAALAALLAAIAGPLTMLAPIPAAILIAGLSSDKGPVARILAAWPIWWTGRISLSLYLVHTPICHILEHARPVLARHVGDGMAGSLTAAAMYATSLAVSVLTYNLVERPGQTLGRSIVRRLYSKPKDATAKPEPTVVSPIEIAPNAR